MISNVLNHLSNGIERFEQSVVLRLLTFSSFLYARDRGATHSGPYAFSWTRLRKETACRLSTRLVFKRILSGCSDRHRPDLSLCAEDFLRFSGVRQRLAVGYSLLLHRATSHLRSGAQTKSRSGGTRVFSSICLGSADERICRKWGPVEQDECWLTRPKANSKRSVSVVSGCRSFSHTDLKSWGYMDPRQSFLKAQGWSSTRNRACAVINCSARPLCPIRYQQVWPSTIGDTSVTSEVGALKLKLRKVALSQKYLETKTQDSIKTRRDLGKENVHCNHKNKCIVTHQ